MALAQFDLDEGVKAANRNSEHWSVIKPELGVTSVRDMNEKDWDSLFSKMNRFGCVHIRQSGDATGAVDSLRQLSKPFGQPIFHKLSDQHGIHPIRYIPGYPEYANANVEELGLHTDGSFEQVPPTYMLMYCEQPAEEGGDSRLASGDELFWHLRDKHQDYLATLCKPSAFKITRDDRTAKRAVFTSVNGRLRLAYRSGNDIRLEIDPEAVTGFKYIQRWLQDPVNFVDFKLRSGETLIFDNTRMLHGRGAFPRESSRSMYGLWCDGQSEFSDRLSWGINPHAELGHLLPQ